MLSHVVAAYLLTYACVVLRALCSATPSSSGVVTNFHGVEIVIPEQYHLRPSLPSTVGICGIFKDLVAADLTEWLTYHSALGVSHFYLYSHNTTNGVEQDLDSWIQAGIVTLLLIPEEPGATKRNVQTPAYGHCVKYFGPRHAWLGFFDLDEFVWIHEEQYPSLPALLQQQYSNYSGLALNWLVYGSGGHDRRPTGTMLQSYDNCARPAAGSAAAQHPMMLHVKVLVRTAYGQNSGMFGHPHNIAFSGPCVDEEGQPLGPVVDELYRVVGKHYLVETPTHTIISLLHYTIKSREDFMGKLERGTADGNRKGGTYFDDVNKLTPLDCALPKLDVGDIISEWESYGSNANNKTDSHISQEPRKLAEHDL